MDFAFRGNVTDKPASPISDIVATPERVQVAQGVIQGMKIHDVAPIYPEEARQARIQGTVLLRAVIGKDGRIAQLDVISGPKQLIQAATGAVQQWRYKPYMRNNEPVEVDTQITVNFTLGGHR
jgi:protein TonB